MAGRLEVVTGCMFSGKTEELLRRAERARIAGKKVLLFKPEIDTRYAPEEVVTHYGRSLPCRRLPGDLGWGRLVQAVGEEALRGADVLAFDEAHFFGREFPSLCERLVALGRRVIVAGLDLNFRGNRLGPCRSFSRSRTKSSSSPPCAQCAGSRRPGPSASWTASLPPGARGPHRGPGAVRAPVPRPLRRPR